MKTDDPDIAPRCSYLTRVLRTACCKITNPNPGLVLADYRALGEKQDELAIAHLSTGNLSPSGYFTRSSSSQFHGGRPRKHEAHTPDDERFADQAKVEYFSIGSVNGATN
jgi:hypothetical protein